MHDPVILFAPLCVEGKVDVPSLRGLLDVLAINLQTYFGIEVKAPLFVADHQKKKSWQQMLVWRPSHQQEKLMELVEQCGPEITNILIPTVTGKRVNTISSSLSLHIKIVNVSGDFAVYQQQWTGSLRDIVSQLAQATQDIVKELGTDSTGHEKWPLTDNEKTLKLFLQGVNAATTFQLGLGKNDFQQVISSLWQAFESDPALDLAAYHLVGFLENILHDPHLPSQLYQTALHTLNELEKSATLPGPLHLLIADTYRNMGKRNIEKNIKAALQKSPDQPEVVISVGNYYEEKKAWNRAKEIYEKYLHTHPDAKAAHLMLHNLGTVHAEQGHIDKAIDFWCQALRIQQNYATAYANLMNAYLEKKEYSKMWVAFEEGLKYPPVSWYSYEHVIYHLDEIGDFSSGIQTIQEYIEINPDDQGAYLFLGLIFSHMCKQHKAETVLQEGIDKGTLEFTDDIARLLLILKVPDFEKRFARCHDYLTQGDLSSAIKFLKECIGQVNTFWPLWLLLGKVYQERKQPRRALKALQEANRLLPEHPDIINEIGIVSTTIGNHRRALKYFTKAVELSPFNSDYLCNLALELIKNGDYEEAHHKIERALLLKANDKTAKSIAAILNGEMRFMPDETAPDADTSEPKPRKRRKPRTDE
jgi:tetratricopeptide (TPR) repeat protein